MKRILLVSPDTVDIKMAGPGIRYLNFAKELSEKLDVTLFIPNKISKFDFQNIPFKVIKGDVSLLKKCANEVDSVLVQGIALRLYPFLKRINKPLVVDLYDPITLENLELRKNLNLIDRVQYHETDLDLILEQLAKGDFFICASEKQKDYWMGMLAAINRVNPATYLDENSMKKLIGVVPFGLDNNTPVKNRKVLKGVWPEINDTDKVLIWGGGIWNWFDPITLIEAMNLISKTRDDVKLFFMGIGHPNADTDISSAEECIELCKEYGLYNKFVFFNDWVPYEERQNYLLEADIGISTYYNNLETRYSFRTRILDYIWCELPMILTKGDYMAELVEREALGFCVEEKNSEMLAEKIISLIEDEGFYNKAKHNLKVLGKNYKWSSVVRPLVEFCLNPSIASDKKCKVKVFYKKGIWTLLKYYWVRIKNKIKRIKKNKFKS